MFLSRINVPALKSQFPGSLRKLSFSHTALSWYRLWEYLQLTTLGSSTFCCYLFFCVYKIRLWSTLNVVAEIHSSLWLDWLVGRNSEKHSVETATLLKKVKNRPSVQWAHLHFNLVYLFAFCTLFPRWTKTLSIQYGILSILSMWTSGLNCISHFLHKIFF